MIRKTYEIKQLVDKANAIFKQPENELYNNRSTRKALGNFVSTILMDAKSYHGFCYLTSNELVNKDEMPGVIMLDGKNTFPDDSRVHYFL